MSDEADILGRINALVQTEHELRDTPGHDTTRLRDIEHALDQCWDLLRQRRARQEFGQDPDEVDVRPEATVEGYLQ
ncbi:DUF2630 family protein [Microlunatus ginsengisoli]|uniref:DUF2630 family protein n=1 Tax=Microlunatus ginsengisoli TaxID=363863 RepID=A0ABP7AHG0_9ACTN